MILGIQRWELFKLALSIQKIELIALNKRTGTLTASPGSLSWQYKLLDRQFGGQLIRDNVEDLPDDQGVILRIFFKELFGVIVTIFSCISYILPQIV